MGVMREMATAVGHCRTPARVENSISHRKQIDEIKPFTTSFTAKAVCARMSPKLHLKLDLTVFTSLLTMLRRHNGHSWLD